MENIVRIPLKLLDILTRKVGIKILGGTANIFRNGEGIQPHKHYTGDELESGFICGNVFLSGPNPGTWYEEVGTIVSEIGTLVIFPNDYIHGVPANTRDCVRVSMAFDIYTNPDDFNMVNENPSRYILIK